VGAHPGGAVPAIEGVDRQGELSTVGSLSGTVVAKPTGATSEMASEGVDHRADLDSTKVVS
jgi:hypothetical protein